MENKVILTVAPVGSVPTRKDTPYLPITPEEIADEVYACWKEGAAIAHIHVRDDEGNPTMDFDKIEKTYHLIREKCDIVINLTSSGDLFSSDERRIRPFAELKPEIATFDCGTMNWAHTTVFHNTPEFLEKSGRAMTEKNVKPEVEIFDAGMVYNAEHYRKINVLKDPVHFQFVLGAPGGMTATVDNLVFLKNLIPKNATWGAFGIGRAHLPILYATLALGGHIRVGMEDNIYYSKGRLAKSNVEFVQRAKRIVAELDKELATPDEARQILNTKNNLV